MSGPTVIAWILLLTGHEFDLEDLPVYLFNAPVTVVKRKAEYFLHVPASVVGDGFEQVSNIAAHYLALINGVASLVINGFNNIELAGGGFYGIDANGDVTQTVLQINSAVSRHKAGHVTLAVKGVTQPDDRLGLMSALLEGAIGHRAKADALALIGRPSPTWSELYLVFELVEANAGSHMHSEGWISKSDARLFTRTANSYTALGRVGRHGKNTGEPPDVPMTQQAAVTLIRTLVAHWLKDNT